YNIALVIASPLVAILMFSLLITIGRGIRGIYHWLARLLDRWVGARAARATAWIAAAALTYLVISGVLLNGLVALMNQAFSVQNGITPPGVHKPTTSLRSGGPGSLVPWDSLGREGRKFIGTGPSPAEIESFTHQPAKEPIRTYAGVESAGNTEDRAALAVADLERTGGFKRKNLLVFTTTGSGWVDPASADTFEFLSDGDSAIVTIQYSYLPSWLSYLVDQTKARAAGRDLFDAVYDKWSKLAPTARPKLYVGGESLGTYGGESAFSGEYDLSNRTDGALFAGPPNFNTLFREFSDNRDSGSLESQPVYKKGRIVRFSNDPGKAIPPGDQPWDGTRVLYLMHPSDPIVWWDWSLVHNKPDWTSEPPGSDVLKQAVWVPFLTFWQITGDLPFATGVPSGHGHTYKSEYVEGWNAVMRTGLTKEQANTLRDIIAGVNQD
ncbi:MAG TPA: alpha/beta hydrolase, partial [Kribbella sp.]